MPSRRFGSCALLSFLALSSQAAEADPPRLSPVDLISLRTVAEVVLSPDGARMIYRLERWPEDRAGVRRRVGELWLVSTSAGAPQLLRKSGFNARHPRWSPRGDRLAWIAQQDDRALPQVVMAKPGDEPTVLTDAPGGVLTFEWSPDGHRIAYTARDSPDALALAARRAGRDWIVMGESHEQIRLHVLDLEPRAITPVTSGNMTVHDFAWSADGRRFAVAAAPGPGEDDRALRTQAYVVDARGGPLRLLAETAGKLTHPAWSGDGRWIAWLGSTRITDPAAGSVFVVPADAPEPPRNLTEAFGGTATWLGALPGKGATFVFRAEEGQATVLRSVDAPAGDIHVLNAAPQILSSSGASSGASFSADGRSFAVIASSSAHPDEVFVGEIDSPRALRRVTRSNPALEKFELGTQEVVGWRSPDGLRIEGVLVKPVGFVRGRRYPVVLHVHGGSESVVSNGWLGSFRDWGQALAARGYLVLYPNYRGSRGRGVEFVSANRGDMMGREWEDIESGLDHLIAAGIADPERAGIYGFSWGGYAAGWGATHASHRFKAAVGGAGIYNWISEAGTNNTRMHEQLAHWGAPLYENFELYLSRSPIYKIHKARTPILLLHGEDDDSCPLGQAIEFHTALKWRGVPVELVIYPREAHGMAEYEHQLDFLTRGLAWFDRHLADERPVHERAP